MPPAKTSPTFGTREPASAPEFKEQYLFLLEFFVQCITGERLAKLNQMFFVPTSVCFQFLSFRDKDIEVTPVDPMFEPQAGIADDIEYFYSGKSVMFAVAEEVALNQISEFKVTLLVQKMMPDNIKPNVLVGEGILDLTEHFNELRTELQYCRNDNVPTPKSCETEVPLVFNDRIIGTVGIYARMSAFGQTIVTEFEAPPVAQEKPSTFVFRGDEMDDRTVAYKCRTIDSSNVDICKDSQVDVSLEPPCPSCVPTRYPCAPCGMNLGAIPATSLQDLTLVPGSPLGPTAGIIQSSRGPVQPCGKAVVLKVSGLLDGGTIGQDGNLKQPTVTVLPESEATGPASPPDPDHDVFILRIGKKGLVGIGEKSDIQLEMRTPKGPVRRPPIRYETREAQTDSEPKGQGAKKGKKKK